MNARQTHLKRILIAVSITGALVLCVVFISSVYRGNPHVGVTGEAYFYDLRGGTVFVAPASSVPPIQAPSGNGPDGKPAGVRAYIYSCDEDYADFRGMTADQVEQSGAFIGYLEKRTDYFKEYMANTERDSTAVDPAVAARMVKQPILIQKLGDQRWVPDISPRGQKIQQAARQRCPGTTAVLCNPR
jgi:hypothetical protein